MRERIRWGEDREKKLHRSGIASGRLSENHTLEQLLFRPLTDNAKLHVKLLAYGPADTGQVDVRWFTLPGKLKEGSMTHTLRP